MARAGEKTVSRRSVPGPGRLVVSVIFRDEGARDAAILRLGEVLGEMRPEGGTFRFDATEYYAEEMGGPLFRQFVVASAPVPRDALPEIKVLLERIERDMAEGERRVVNLDPGLITPENFILATGKNYTHRVYLRDGVFADLTLEFRSGEFRALPWTYPDYASAEIRALLKSVRAEFLSRGESGGARKCG
jgi:hypothetical protein